MELPAFMYSVLASNKREKLVIKRKVKVIREFLGKRRKLESEKEDEMIHLKQLCKNRSIDEETYHRLKQLMILTFEQKRIDLVKSVIEKNFLL